MRIYFDSCSLQRPLDTKSQPRIVVESEAVLTVIDLCDSGQVELVSSEALTFETRRIPNATRREFAQEILRKTKVHIDANEQVRKKAEEFTESGIKPLDALHLASSIAAEADFFCTCDDKFLKKARAVDSSPAKVVSPLELVTEIDV